MADARNDVDRKPVPCQKVEVLDGTLPIRGSVHEDEAVPGKTGGLASEPKGWSDPARPRCSEAHVARSAHAENAREQDQRWGPA